MKEWTNCDTSPLGWLLVWFSVLLWSCSRYRSQTKGGSVVWSEMPVLRRLIFSQQDPPLLWKWKAWGWKFSHPGQKTFHYRVDPCDLLQNYVKYKIAPFSLQTIKPVSRGRLLKECQSASEIHHCSAVHWNMATKEAASLLPTSSTSVKNAKAKEERSPIQGAFQWLHITTTALIVCWLAFLTHSCIRQEAPQSVLTSDVARQLMTSQEVRGSSGIKSS